MLPALGYWIAPENKVHFSLLMLVVGTLYSALSVVRRSFLFGILAALAANSGLWYLLYKTDGLGILDHPQLWLIPPSLCVLVASYLNRDRLSPAEMTTVRYLCSTTIYAASTADIFLNGVAEAPWLPLVLAGISILGILAGIILRARAFLLLGTAFLVIAMLTVIWYAAVDLHQTWLWYLSGIVLGALILAMFAVFEKKRQEVLDVVERLKEWDA
jgi:fructose-specific phosphotransferase system IIC component